MASGPLLVVQHEPDAPVAWLGEWWTEVGLEPTSSAATSASPCPRHSAPTTGWSSSVGRWGRATTRRPVARPDPLPHRGCRGARRADPRRVPRSPARRGRPRAAGSAQPVGSHRRARALRLTDAGADRCFRPRRPARRSTTTTTSSARRRRVPGPRDPARRPTPGAALRAGRVGRAVPPRDLPGGVRGVAAVGLTRWPDARAGGAARRGHGCPRRSCVRWQPLAERSRPSGPDPVARRASSVTS